MANQTAGSTSFRKLPPDRWPSDCRALLKGTQDGRSSFSVSGAWRPKWSSGTREMRLADFAIFLNWFIESGRYQAGLSVAVQVTYELVEAYYLALEKAGLSFNTRARRLNGLYAALRQLAPPADRWRWLQKAAKECEGFAAETKQACLDDPSTEELAQVARELFRRAEQGDESNLDSALLFRDGLLILLFALAGPRRHTLYVMDIGVNLKAEGDDWVVEWPAQQMKGGKRGVRRALPRLLAVTTAKYIEKHRPVLMARAAAPAPGALRAVWISDRGTRLCESSIYKRVCKWTEEILHKRINPHRFRHAGATTLAVLHPEEVALVTPWLTHSCRDSARQSYILAQDIDATRRFAETIDEERFGREKSDEDR